MANKIQIRRGLKTNLPVLDAGEPALCTDTGEVFVGNTSAPVQLVNNAAYAEHLKDYVLQIPYAAAGGSANAYTVSLNPALAAYAEGVAVAVKINGDNTGAATLNINSLGAKSIVDSKGSALTAGKLKANSIYTLRYNGTNFILQGEGASGNALASDLLSGKTASTDAGEITGTMPNCGAVSITPGSTSQAIAAGYHNGSGSVAGDADLTAANIKDQASIFGVTGTFTQEASVPITAATVLNGKKGFVNGAQIVGSMPDRGAVTITPSASNQSIAQGYHNGSGYVAGDTDLIAANIKSGVNIFGVTGTAQIRNFASGTVPQTGWSGEYPYEYISIYTGFQPTMILWTWTSLNSAYITLYSPYLANVGGSPTDWFNKVQSIRGVTLEYAQDFRNMTTWSVTSTGYTFTSYGNHFAKTHTVTWYAWG